jgi:hypothetical protein
VKPLLRSLAPWLFLPAFCASILTDWPLPANTSHGAALTAVLSFALATGLTLE